MAIGLAFAYIIVFFLTELFFSALEGSFKIGSNAFVSSMVSILLFGIFGALIGLVVKMINHGADMPDLLQSIKNIGIHAYDALTMFGGEYDSYKLP